MHVQGHYFPKASSNYQQGVANIRDTLVEISHDDQLISSYAISDITLTSGLAGLADELRFNDGSRFIPSDVNYRWPFKTDKHDLLERLEKSKWAIIAAIVVTPLFMWLMLYKVVPAIAVYSVDTLPHSVVEQMGEQSFTVIKKLALDPTELSAEQQATVQQNFNTMLDALALEKSVYRLSFYKSQSFGANAFALPHGRIVVTDELANLLADKPNALKAVLLHEIGHVVHQHSVRITAQSAASTIVLAVIFGDLEGIAEVALGTGASFAQQGFSRDMEREADSYALTQLEDLGYSSNDFADAIEALQGAHTTENEHLKKVNNLLEYLSSHPSSQERINNARK
ncbi:MULTISPECIES: M48 family metallopeptidase [unclassified Pseudoalteromonas]|uniref:M48 family metallopeptidase n=1 Tax=unclassified Pseudoalteromonas TaxID=194690 RepID=UPI0011082907|nr:MULTISPECIES: M48 family metallopeptidase [unclassified Pseudoalteromonas]TMN85645.1 peptidase [Pseudoalteromonas sp. S410]TMN92973.1 peptidase [Pseudoalteromonas sp. S408]TMN96650.1 peptidase [Pseudoalteromonas sp. S409]TMN99465.1 peptidase [Pseudoalteromonas sp. S407]TMO08524.1 peptidase [Pseudoalteromonas sp. S186]